MKKKKVITIIIIICIFLIILLIPIPTHYKDGGTLKLNAIVYSYTQYHVIGISKEDFSGADKVIENFENDGYKLVDGYFVKKEFLIFPFKFIR